MKLPRTPSFRLDGRRALVAGGSSGIGLGCAVALAEQGAEVTIGARSADRVEEAADALRAEGWAAQGIVLDVADAEATAETVARHGPFDVLVNSAGVARHAPALETTAADFDMAASLNLRGAYFLTREVARGLVAAGRPGSLINVSSQMGHIGGIDRAVYCATKHGVEGFTRAMAIELGPHGIRVNTICPTFIRTPLAAATLDDPERRAWIEGKIKLGRIGEVEDVMGAVAWLASDAAALVTGAAILIDGGWTAG